MCGIRPGVISRKRIVGGGEAVPNSWPWQVSLLRDSLTERSNVSVSNTHGPYNGNYQMILIFSVHKLQCSIFYSTCSILHNFLNELCGRFLRVILVILVQKELFLNEIIAVGFPDGTKILFSFSDVCCSLAVENTNFLTTINLQYMKR